MWTPGTVGKDLAKQAYTQAITLLIWSLGPQYKPKLNNQFFRKERSRLLSFTMLLINTLLFALLAPVVQPYY